MRITFVGGTQFIGHAAAVEAVRRGHQVTVAHRGIHPCEVEGARSLPVDRRDPGALALALRKARPDVVVDTRAMTRADAEAVALAVRILGVPCVVVSSQDVYAQFGLLNGLPAPPPEPLIYEGSPLTVPFPFRGVGAHEGGEDYDKKLVEEVFAAATRDGIPGGVALRLPAVYGARDPKRRFGVVVDAFDAGVRELPQVGGAAWRWSHAHVRDVAAAIVGAAERVPGGWCAFNVGESAVPSMRERVEAIARRMGVAFEWVPAPAPLAPDLAWLGAMATDFVVDTSLVRRTLGVTEVTTEDERLDDLVAGLRRSRPRWNGKRTG